MPEILLVDDSDAVLLTLAIALRRRGHIVTMASSGLEALRELETRHFDVMVSDVRMPGMDGTELARRASSLPAPPRVILTSAHATVEERDQVAEAFLRKPIDIDFLESLLRSTPLKAAPSPLASPRKPNGLPADRAKIPPETATWRAAI